MKLEIELEIPAENSTDYQLTAEEKPNIQPQASAYPQSKRPIVPRNEFEKSVTYSIDLIRSFNFMALTLFFWDESNNHDDSLIANVVLKLAALGVLIACVIPALGLVKNQKAIFDRNTNGYDDEVYISQNNGIEPLDVEKFRSSQNNPFQIIMIDPIPEIKEIRFKIGARDLYQHIRSALKLLRQLKNPALINEIQGIKMNGENLHWPYISGDFEFGLTPYMTSTCDMPSKLRFIDFFLGISGLPAGITVFKYLTKYIVALDPGMIKVIVPIYMCLNWIAAILESNLTKTLNVEASLTGFSHPLKWDNSNNCISRQFSKATNTYFFRPLNSTMIKSLKTLHEIEQILQVIKEQEFKSVSEEMFKKLKCFSLRTLNESHITPAL